MELSRSDFLKAMSIKIAKDWDITLLQADINAQSMLEDFLAMSDIKFGDPDFDWSKGGAEEIVFEFMQYD